MKRIVRFTLSMICILCLTGCGLNLGRIGQTESFEDSIETDLSEEEMYEALLEEQDIDKESTDDNMMERVEEIIDERRENNDYDSQAQVEETDDSWPSYINPCFREPLENTLEAYGFDMRIFSSEEEIVAAFGPPYTKESGVLIYDFDEYNPVTGRDFEKENFYTRVRLTGSSFLPMICASAFSEDDGWYGGSIDPVYIREYMEAQGSICSSSFMGYILNEDGSYSYNYSLMKTYEDYVEQIGSPGTVRQVPNKYFIDISWLLPEDEDYYETVITKTFDLSTGEMYSDHISLDSGRERSYEELMNARIYKNNGLVFEDDDWSYNHERNSLEIE